MGSSTPQAAATTTEERHTAAIFERARQSVVSVTNIASVRRSLFSLELEKLAQGAGSGFVWDKEGNIVTNYHVILNATDIKITLPNGKSCPARIVGADPERDIAVLQIPKRMAGKLQPIPLDSPSTVVVGQNTYAIGHPFGLDQTLTKGIVSGIGRSFQTGTTGGRPMWDIIQTDAAVNQGSSGGPLLDSSGRLIGVNTFIMTPSGANAGVAFAIPVKFVAKTVRDILKYGRVRRASLGVSLAPDHIVSQLGIQGALVFSVEEGGTAKRAGVTPLYSKGSYNSHGDVIVGINGKKVDNTKDVFMQLEDAQIGETVVLRVAPVDEDGKMGNERNVKIKLQELLVKKKPRARNGLY